MEKIPQTLAERVDWLFSNIRRENGKEHSFQEVENATRELGYPVTGTYIWKMRNGQAQKPNWLILRTFAKFFNVPITFFYDEKLTKEKLDHILEEAGYDISMPTPALRRIRKDPEVEQMAKEVSQLDTLDRQTILDVIRVIMKRGKKWWQNVRYPVRFAQACQNLMEAGFDTFLEIGAHPVLVHSMKECLAEADKQAVVLPSLRRKKAERVMMLASLGQLYTLGYSIDSVPFGYWNRLYATEHHDPNRVRLPSYAWQRERYWHESDASRQARQADEQQRAMLGQQVHPLLGAKLQAAYPVWDVEIAQQLSYLSDHLIQGSVVYPAAAYVEMALAATPSRGGGRD